MTDEPPRKTLTITRKPAIGGTAPPTTTPAPTAGAVTRTGKRIITRDQLPTPRASIGQPNYRKPGQQPKPKPKVKRPRQPPKPPKTPPSDIRARELNDSLNAYPVWRNHQPLSLGIEKQVFRHVAELHLSASKRVVQKLLHYQTHNRRYLQNVAGGGTRHNLDGTDGGAVLPHERDHAARDMATMPQP